MILAFVETSVETPFFPNLNSILHLTGVILTSEAKFYIDIVNT